MKPAGYDTKVTWELCDRVQIEVNEERTEPRYLHYASAFHLWSSRAVRFALAHQMNMLPQTIKGR